MESGKQTRSSKLFMVIALVLTASLFLGLLGIGGIVLFRFLVGPVEVAMPPGTDVPSQVPEGPMTPTPSPLPSATPTTGGPGPTATLVVPGVTETLSVDGQENGSGQNGPGMSSPGSGSSEMPQTGFGPLETLGIGAVLVFLLGASHIARRPRLNSDR